MIGGLLELQEMGAQVQLNTAARRVMVALWNWQTQRETLLTEPESSEPKVLQSRMDLLDGIQNDLSRARMDAQRAVQDVRNANVSADITSESWEVDTLISAAFAPDEEIDAARRRLRPRLEAAKRVTGDEENA